MLSSRVLPVESAMRSFLRILALSGIAAISAVGLCQGAPPTVTLKAAAGSVTAGKAFSAVLTITFPDGLHGYQNPPTDPSLIPLAVTAGDKVFKLVKVAYPKGTPTKVAGEDKPINVYSGTIKVPVTLQAPTKLGKAVIKLSVGYQECNEQSCFPPGSVVAQVPVTVVKSSSTPSPKVGKSE